MNSLTILVSALLIVAISAAAIREERLNRREPKIFAKNKVGLPQHNWTPEQTENVLQGAIKHLLDTEDIIKDKDPSAVGIDSAQHLAQNLTKINEELKSIEHLFDPRGHNVISGVEKNLTQLIRVLSNAPQNISVANKTTAIKVILSMMDDAINNLENIQEDILLVTNGHGSGSGTNTDEETGPHHIVTSNDSSSSSESTAFSESTESSTPSGSTESSALPESGDSSAPSGSTESSASPESGDSSAPSGSTKSSASPESGDSSAPSGSTESSASPESGDSSAPSGSTESSEIPIVSTQAGDRIL